MRDDKTECLMKICTPIISFDARLDADEPSPLGQQSIAIGGQELAVWGRKGEWSG